LEDTNPNDLCHTSASTLFSLPKAGLSYIEPSESAARPPQLAFIAVSTEAFLHPVHGPDPVQWLDTTEILLLGVEIGCNVRAKQSEKGGNRKWLITITNQLKVYRVPIIVDTEK
jgi:hypothetical protein